MDSGRLARMFEYVEEQQVNLHSLLVVRNGYLVTEAYFQPYDQDTPHWIASVTQSVIGMLVGIAIDQGSIEGVGQPVLDFFPGRTIANQDADKEALTVEHLLSLTAGLDCHDGPGSGDPTMEQSEDWVQFMLDLPLASPPGSTFNYCSGAAHLLSAIVQQATGVSAREFANEPVQASGHSRRAG
jgi:CubicO group peptidase (beta-lactamase class C family)